MLPGALLEPFKLPSVKPFREGPGICLGFAKLVAGDSLGDDCGVSLSKFRESNYVEQHSKITRSWKANWFYNSERIVV
ncbi:MAG: hypothetical protein AMK69_10860 [Nitrospira bacterium SG8_3]|nr:MAG: hypothetical protein AMK69_10860 [Nitrospira bacterium SG8_3]